jgi:hypothetical protein
MAISLVVTNINHLAYAKAMPSYGQQLRNLARQGCISLSAIFGKSRQPAITRVDRAVWRKVCHHTRFAVMPRRAGRKKARRKDGLSNRRRKVSFC